MAKAKATSTKKEKAPAAVTVTRSTAKPSINWGGELVLGALVAELFGTFVLTTVLLNAGGNVFIAAVTVIFLVMALSRLSGGHINPAFTIAMLATKQISAIKAGGYIVAQVIGAMLALTVVTQFVNTAPVDATLGQTMTVFKAADIVGDWRPFFAEALGGLIFGLGAAAAVLGRKNSHETGFIVGGSLLLGLIAATLASAAIVNPAVAVGLSAYHFDNWWTVAAYALAPALGAVAGAWLYKLLQWDVTGTKEA